MDETQKLLDSILENYNKWHMNQRRLCNSAGMRTPNEIVNDPVLKRRQIEQQAQRRKKREREIDMGKTYRKEKFSSKNLKKRVSRNNAKQELKRKGMKEWIKLQK